MSFASYPSLRGKVAFVSGGASGIGADIVRAFHAQGARVGFVDIRDDDAAALDAECGGALAYRHCDITDVPALQAAIAEIAAEIGPITVLVNNAANDKREAVDEIGVEAWDLSQSLNIRHQFFAAQAVRAGMATAGGGAIVNFSSIAWKGGAPNMTPYVTAKAAVIGLTRSLANAFGADGIRVNAIEPGAVITPRQRALWFKTEDAVQAMVGRQAIKRVLLGEEIARTVLFLASDDARMITKQTIVVDAGLR